MESPTWPSKGATTSITTPIITLIKTTTTIIRQ